MVITQKYPNNKYFGFRAPLSNRDEKIDSELIPCSTPSIAIVRNQSYREEDSGAISVIVISRSLSRSITKINIKIRR